MTVFRSTFAKDKLKTFYYPCYKKFYLEHPEMELKENQMRFPITHLIFFLQNLKHLLINSLHSKRKNRFNNSIFMTKSLRKAILLRSQLKRKFKHSETKMKYFQNMDVSKVNVNKMCWKTVKPSFTYKCKTVNTIILTERGYYYEK